ncbi:MULTISPECIES: phosphate ABC transporter permease subunit PstC [Moorena]|uniref:Phosphate transport system permease protein n=1 Tax=Moorena producens 3L TaxID=489825 RepID=F4Y280_9CYAN|nr:MULTISPECIES: phosphate ABC transporter permease subunit PstC [Moorena]EGJ29372.1 phosphate ABC transporter, PhoT family TC 3.A.1.7.1, membrane protein 1 [Moorena producens 3L]NEP67786.1 phosphate ABC transporter permease subunit PstC [Moorena sp. SIO3A5]NEQ06376.1 phosphate ABC transporter permease subunit PstC [Moorena sp. SIO4E2]NER90206.1 phosphate ABC transporter permease subunit PstC [Moorena sp. SIO3A2]NES43929.1 phosphate ABC transporter permease subunit PstC [Moorena sp. SIO2C4]
MLNFFRSDTLLISILQGCAVVAGAIVVLILVFLITEALPVLGQVGLLPFFTDPSWHPAESLYNFTPMLWGTLFVTAGAMVVATPLGILSAVFCQYYAPSSIAGLYRRLIELLAGMPSVVYGFWGLVELVPLIGRFQPPGASLLAGIAILTLMILPTIALTADASFAKVAPEYLKGAAALGLSRWATVRGVVFPAAKSGLFTGLILGTGRAIGETMAVLMVCGNVVQIPKSLFEPMRTLTANIALEMAYAMGNHRSALFVSGLLLMAIILVLVAIAEMISKEGIYE